MKFNIFNTQFKTGLAIVTPSRGMISLDWHNHMNQLRGNLPPGFTYNLYTTKGKSLPEAYTELVKRALADKNRYIMLIEDDVFIPQRSISQLWSRQKDVVCGVYWQKSLPSFPLIFKEVGMGPALEKFRDPENGWEPGDFFQVWVGAMGCCLIKSEVFEKVPEPWFVWDWWRQGPKGERVFTPQSADIYFFEKIRQYGCEVWADTSVLCDHYDWKTERKYPDDSIREGLAEIAKQREEEIEEKEDGTFLNIGSGPAGNENFKEEFKGWKEVRLDLDERTKPEIISDARNMHMISDDHYDAVFMSHVLEHFTFVDREKVLAESRRVIRPGGYVKIVVPNLKTIGEYVSRGELDKVVYNSPGGPITVEIMLYGIQIGEFQEHKCGFTKENLEKLLRKHFINVNIEEEEFNLIAWGYKNATNTMESSL